MGGLFEITFWLKNRKSQKRVQSDLLGGCFLEHFGDPLAAEMAQKAIWGASVFSVFFRCRKGGEGLGGSSRIHARKWPVAP